MLKFITPDTFARFAAHLRRDLDVVCAPVPDGRRIVADLTEADYDAIGASLAEIMLTCANYLGEAGFEAEAAEAVAEQVKRQYARLQALRSAGTTPAGAR